ncbi:MAG: prepilin-type N-terminal cleavage/methylation domain-containing protein [Puniceicoccales bacterium]|jgi:type II secretory pathway pseudopilin PulG|nr:prepilin-type N-terminal cleavage/methylation domain-containing protein [Puniceicoccales bacterium]
MVKRRGYLLIEVIIGLSIFALFAGVVTQGFLVGLKLYGEADDADPNAGVIAAVLANRIKSSTGPDTSIEMGFDAEKWKMDIRAKGQVSNISQKLYAFSVNVAKIADIQGNRSDRAAPQEYHIFRYLP